MNAFAPRNLIAAAAIAVVAGIAFTSSSASAATYDNLNKCHFATKEKVIKCCETIIRKKGRPLWFRETSSNCSTVVVCRRSTAITHVAKPRCYVQRKFPESKSVTAPVNTPPQRDEPNNNPNIAGGKN
jgi:hypothetical protein